MTMLASAPGMGEIILILVIALLLFGGRLPEVGRNLGKGIAQFKKGLNEASQEVDSNVKDVTRSVTETPAPPKKPDEQQKA